MKRATERIDATHEAVTRSPLPNAAVTAGFLTGMKPDDLVNIPWGMADYSRV